MKTSRRNQTISNVVYGIISSIFSIPIVAGIKMLYKHILSQDMPWFILALLFVLTLSTILLSIKWYLTSKKTKHVNYEVKDLYLNVESLSKVLQEIIPSAKQVDILDLRGFLYTQQDSLLYKEIINNDKGVFRILLSDPSSNNTNYRATHTPNKSLAAMMNEIQASIDSILEIEHGNIELKVYKNHNIFRLIFVDEELFVTPFRDGQFISSAPTMRFTNNGAFYKCYKDYFQEIWNNQSSKVQPTINTNQSTNE